MEAREKKDVLQDYVEDGQSKVDSSDAHSAELNIGELTVLQAELPRYYSETELPDVKDLIIEVRRVFPNPRQRVIITTDMSVPVKQLADVLIFVQGVNDTEANIIRGLGPYCYCPIEVKQEFIGQGDYGIHAKLAEYTSVYNVTSFDILIYGEEDAMRGAWEFVHEGSGISQQIYFPVSFTTHLKLFTNGLDIAPYARQLLEAQYRNELSSALLKSVMDELRDVVKSGKTAIQDFEETRSIYAKWLTMCLVQEFSLPPVYLGSYISEYINMKVAYPFEKLSFYERVMFLRNLPEQVGYIGKNQEFRCIFSIRKKIYPNPALVFDLEAGCVITEGLEQFALDKVQLADYRSMFPQSQQYFHEKQTGIVKSAGGDADVDRKLVSMFTGMTDRVAGGEVYLTIRNTCIAIVGGKRYIIYYTEPLGVAGLLQSPYFGTEPFVLYEEEFNNLIDVKIILAIRAQQEERSYEVGSQKFQTIMLKAKSMFVPAIPTFLLMCSELANNLPTDLSYYDQRLRCDKNVVPIITHADSTLRPKITVFDYVSLQNIRKDIIGRNALTAFGTLNSEAGYINKIPVSTETFRGSGLL